MPVSNTKKLSISSRIGGSLVGGILGTVVGPFSTAGKFLARQVFAPEPQLKEIRSYSWFGLNEEVRYEEQIDDRPLKALLGIILGLIIGAPYGLIRGAYLGATLGFKASITIPKILFTYSEAEEDFKKHREECIESVIRFLDTYEKDPTSKVINEKRLNQLFSTATAAMQDGMPRGQEIFDRACLLIGRVYQGKFMHEEACEMLGKVSKEGDFYQAAQRIYNFSAGMILLEQKEKTSGFKKILSLLRQAEKYFYGTEKENLVAKDLSENIHRDVCSMEKVLKENNDKTNYKEITRSKRPDPNSIPFSDTIQNNF